MPMQREDTPIHIPSLDGKDSELPSILPERSLATSSWASIDLNDGGASARNIAGASSPSFKTTRGEGILSTPLSFTPHEVLLLGLAGAGLAFGSALFLAAVVMDASSAASPLVIPGLAAASAAGLAALRVKALDRRIQAIGQQGIMGKAATDAAAESRSFGLAVPTLCQILRGCSVLMPITALIVTIVLSLEFSRTQSRLVVAALAVFDIAAGVGTWVLWNAAIKLGEMGEKIDATTTSSLRDIEMPAAEESKQERARTRQ